MHHIAILCPPTTGHLNPLAALGRELRDRGHRVSLVQIPALRTRAGEEGLDFVPLGDSDATTARLTTALTRLSQLSGMPALRFTIRVAAEMARVVFDEAPSALHRAGVDLALVDQNEPAGATVCEHLGLPFVSVAGGLPINREPDVPPPFMSWPFVASRWGRFRNAAGYRVSDVLLAPITAVLNERRRHWRLPALRSPDDSFSQLAQLCTLPRALDFPRRALPRTFHYVGPLTDRRSRQVEFPWQQLSTRRPIVYASFGTLQTGSASRFRAVLEGCRDLDVQLVMSTGGGRVPRDWPSGDSVVVPYAPQEAVLARCAAAITHAGLNTVLDALTQAVPMVAVPVTNDQPAVAARVRHAGAGVLVPAPALTAPTLNAALRRVLEDPEFARRARHLSTAIAEAGGVRRGADVVEAVA